MLHWWQMPSDPELTTFFAADRTPPAGRNINYFEDEELTRLLYASDRTVDRAERKALLAARAGDRRRRWCRRFRSTASPGSTRCRPRCSTSRATRPTPASSGTCTSGKSNKLKAVDAPARSSISLHAVPLLLLISALVFLLIHAAPGGPLAIYLVEPERAARGHRAAAARARPRSSALAAVLVVAGGVRARRLGLQLQRRPPGRQPRARAAAGDARAGRRVARRARWR